MPSLENTTLGKYDIVREIGRGNMATVYLGQDPFADREVAIKVALPDILKDEELGAKFRKMFFNEAKVAGMLKHPNLVSIYDAGVAEDLCYIAMEYVPGDRTLHEHCTPERLLPVVDAVQIIFKCAKALDHAHRQGVIHRDIKPRNVLLTEDRDIKIADFGIALLTRTDTTGTQMMDYVGSPLYMSPEQIRDDNVTTQTDVFSLGVLMYELITGKHPFLADSLAAITHRIVEEDHIPIKDLRSNAPDVLESIVRRALKKKPSARYKTGMDLAADLSLVFDDLTFSEDDLSDREKINLVQDLKFFSEFSEPEIWEVIHASTWQQFDPGQTILIEGELDRSFYVIVSGRVDVMKGAQLVGELGGGMCFGEMGFISGEKRTATVVSKTDVWVMKVNASLIERASVNCQLRFHKTFLQTLVSRLRLTTQEVSELRGQPGPDSTFQTAG